MRLGLGFRDCGDSRLPGSWQGMKEWTRKSLVRLRVQGQGDLVSRLIMGIAGVSTWLMMVTSLLTTSP